MTYGCFRAVLDDLNEAGSDEFPDDWDEEVQRSIEGLAESYAKLRKPDRDLIDYSTLPVQAAYSFMYAVGRAEFLYEILCHTRDKLGAPLFGKTKLRVVSLGGGPASELPGLVKFLDDPDSKEKVQEIDFAVFDKEAAWEHVAELVAEKINDKRVTLTSYEGLDLTQVQTCAAADLSAADLVILSFVISEVCCIPGSSAVRTNLAHMLSRLPPGAAVVYNDSNAYSFYSFMNSVAAGVPKLDQVHEFEGMVELKSPDFSGAFEQMIESTGRTPHLNSRAVAKFYRKS